MHVVDGKEVQRRWHLGVENVKHHRFEHQDKGDKHFIAPGFIQLECLTKEMMVTTIERTISTRLATSTLCISHAQTKIITTLPSNTYNSLLKLIGRKSGSEPMSFTIPRQAM
ncbi:Uncharacterised protein [Escherichia coli]|uniref:Uncharacterized protein n=1 Tax=Escherichia coli TaxID=562 RepID=A0A376MLE8_ECOLX|nr:Uncharacterised protein [Escherichia coli]